MIEAFDRVRAQVRRVIVGQEPTVDLALVAAATGGHVLLEGPPGVAKTLAVNALARALGLEFRRVQFTPDMLPSDVTGTMTLRAGELAFRAGPVFTNVLLADEINRTPPKTQAALLEAMQERQVTIEGMTHQLAPPFLVLATQNPIEYEGTYPLPEAQLDRFMLRVGVGYPQREDEWEVLERRLERATDEVELEPVVGRDELLEMQRAVEQVHVERSVGLYMVDLVAATRDAPGIQVGASPRGSLALLKLSRCRAALAGRDFVIPEDVKAVAVPALAHRLSLRPELWVQRLRPEDLVLELLDRVPTPKAEAEPEPAAE
jgi:MoxR-like ATPase